MSNLVGFTSDPESGEPTPEEEQDHQEFIDHINYLIEEGWVVAEKDTNGNIRLYPA